MTVSPYHPDAFRILKSHAAIEKESQRLVKCLSFIIHPLSMFRKFWNIFIFFVMLIHQMVRSYVVGFSRGMSQKTAEVLLIFDFLGCLVLSLEVLLMFRTGHIIEHTNQIILQPQLIARAYLKNCIFDVINCFPLLFVLPYISDFTSITPSVVGFMGFLFICGTQRFSQIQHYFSSVPIMLNLSEKGSIIFTLCIRTLF